MTGRATAAGRTAAEGEAPGQAIAVGETSGREAPSARERPVPVEPPVYDRALGHRPRGSGPDLFAAADAVFIIIGLLLAMWLGGLYLVVGASLTPSRLLYLVGFWLLLTYIALPRLHQLLTWMYLPDYFFGRTRSTEGVLSDPINLAFDGTEEDLHVAMRRAGWVLAEERTVGSAWGMISATLLRRSYPSAPVSDLYLLGRRHDFTYQQEVGGSTSQRHHVRFWKTPPGFVLPGGHRVDWLAAGTYDRAVGFSFFTLQFTHRIDENIDVERDFIIDTVRYADPRIPVRVIHEFFPSYHHRNGQGDRIRTDGDLPVLDVAGTASRSEGATAMMLPRHRPTGTTVMKARAYSAALAAVGDSRSEELAEQWQETVGDLHRAWVGAADHHLPPPTISLVIAMIALELVASVVAWAAAALGSSALAPLEELIPLLPDASSLAQTLVLGGVMALLMVGVLRRSRWARLALLALFTLDAIARLAAATFLMDGIDHSLLTGMGLSVIGVLAMSSDASRLWVMTQRLRPSESVGSTQRA